MIDLVRENWIFLVLALLIGVAVAWWLLVGGRRTRIEVEHGQESDGPARRNQALIDAPPAAPPPPREVPPPVPQSLAGTGEAVAAGAVPASIAAVVHGSDDLSRIKGVGPKLVEHLHTLGVTSFEQIADWDDAEIDRIDAQLGRFAGRIRRDSWVEQARFLAAGDTSGYEAKFGKL